MFHCELSTFAHMCRLPYLNIQIIDTQCKYVNKCDTIEYDMITICIEFCISEPIGSVKPHVNIGDKMNIANGKINHSINLLCIATGWPVLSFRLITKKQKFFIHSYTTSIHRREMKFFKFVEHFLNELNVRTWKTLTTNSVCKKRKKSFFLIRRANWKCCTTCYTCWKVSLRISSSEWCH